MNTYPIPLSNCCFFPGRRDGAAHGKNEGPVGSIKTEDVFDSGSNPEDGQESARQDVQVVQGQLHDRHREGGLGSYQTLRLHGRADP